MGWPASTPPRAAEELYDVRHDPQEFVNVAERPEYRQVKTELVARLANWMRDTEDFAGRSEPPPRPEAPGWGPWQNLR